MLRQRISCGSDLILCMDIEGGGVDEAILFPAYKSLLRVKVGHGNGVALCLQLI